MNFKFEQDIILEDDLVLLRPIQISDIDFLKPIAIGDQTLLQYSPKPIFTDEYLEKYVRAAIDNYNSQSRYTFVVYHKQDKVYAGCTSFMSISNLDDRLEIGGTWYGRKYHRTGVNRHCKYLMLEYVFEKLGAERVEFKTDERNEASRKAIEGIGGKQEGILRNHMVLSDGYRRNTVYYSILKQEWPTIKTTLIR